MPEIDLHSICVENAIGMFHDDEEKYKEAIERCNRF